MAAYEQQFLPAWRKYRDYITGKYAGAARAAVALSSIPEGREDYAILVRRYTTTTMTADQIHKLGLSEVERI